MRKVQVPNIRRLGMDITNLLGNKRAVAAEYLSEPRKVRSRFSQKEKLKHGKISQQPTKKLTVSKDSKKNKRSLSFYQTNFVDERECRCEISSGVWSDVQTRGLDSSRTPKNRYRTNQVRWFRISSRDKKAGRRRGKGRCRRD